MAKEEKGGGGRGEFPALLDHTVDGNPKEKRKEKMKEKRKRKKKKEEMRK